MSDKPSRKIQRQFDVANPIYNFNRVGKLSIQLKLPFWWVRFVIIEYLPCRRFIENGKSVVFDFGIFDKSQIPSIDNYRSERTLIIQFISCYVSFRPL